MKVFFSVVECNDQMNGPPQIIPIGDDGAIKHTRLFQTCCVEHNIVYIPTQGTPRMVEKRIWTFEILVGQTISAKASMY